MSYATRTATVTLACPAEITLNGEPYPCEADLRVRVRSERNAEGGHSWWEHFAEEITSPCGHVLSQAQQDRLVRDAVEELTNRAAAV